MASVCDAVSGHSLGGALASLAAYDMAVQAGLHAVQCITFGAPRVGNRAFVAAYDAHVKVTWCRAPPHLHSPLPEVMCPAAQPASESCTCLLIPVRRGQTRHMHGMPLER